MNEKISIRKANYEDISAILKLMREFAEFENLAEFLEVTEEKLKDAMFGEGAFVEGLMAFDNKTPIAYAIFFSHFSSFRGQKSLYLEDIYITKDYRKFGIGEKLLKEIARIAKEKGAVRMDFQVLNWNTPAINFYKKHGADIDESERHCRLTDDAFEKLASDLA